MQLRGRDEVWYFFSGNIVDAPLTANVRHHNEEKFVSLYDHSINS